MPAPATLIELTEYMPAAFPAAAFAHTDMQRLYQAYGKQVKIEEPGHFSGQQWRLIAQGWVGYIPFSPALHLALQPKVPLGNLFRMLERVYFDGSLKMLDGMYEAESMLEFFEQLAGVLAQGILNRFRRGIYRAYEPDSDDLQFIRGRLDIAQIMRRPGQVRAPCHFQEFTGDIEDNQILGWTVQRILQTGQCTGRAASLLRGAHRHLQSTVQPTPYTAADCLNRLYTRLNADYHPLHALCYFFLSHTGPTHRQGDRAMLPFLVDMAQLYERFVALWLKAYLPPRYRVKIQERHSLEGNTLVFNIDLVIYDLQEERVRWVLDTKYKTPPSGPSNPDISQAVTYATLKDAPEAILIYPVPLTNPLDVPIGNIRVRSLTFGLDGSLDVAGQNFLRQLGAGQV